MLRLLLSFLFMCVANALCSVSHDELWNCVLKDRCVNVYQLHALSMRRGKKYLQRPFILAMEGPKYRRLFADCDADKNGCLDKSDIKAAGDKCQRSCMWRKTVKSTMCH